LDFGRIIEVISAMMTAEWLVLLSVIRGAANPKVWNLGGLAKNSIAGRDIQMTKSELLLSFRSNLLPPETILGGGRINAT
jgi:hypothetical protein